MFKNNATQEHTFRCEIIQTRLVETLVDRDCSSNITSHPVYTEIKQRMLSYARNYEQLAYFGSSKLLFITYALDELPFWEKTDFHIVFTLRIWHLVLPAKEFSISTDVFNQLKKAVFHNNNLKEFVFHKVNRDLIYKKFRDLELDNKLEMPFIVPNESYDIVL